MCSTRYPSLIFLSCWVNSTLELAGVIQRMTFGKEWVKDMVRLMLMKLVRSS